MADQCDAMLAATQREMDYCKAEFAKHAHTKDEAREWYQTCKADPLRATTGRAIEEWRCLEALRNSGRAL